MINNNTSFLPGAVPTADIADLCIQLCSFNHMFTNFAQNDQFLFSLHTYLMYLKFGFGRATQDAGIEIRRGAMNRDQAINLAKLYDNNFPENFIKLYLDYYKMDISEFNAVIDKFANKQLFKKISGRWEPQFSIE